MTAQCARMTRFQCAQMTRLPHVVDAFLPRLTDLKQCLKMLFTYSDGLQVSRQLLKLAAAAGQDAAGT